MNEKLYVLKNYENTAIIFGKIHMTGMTYIADNLTNGTIPAIDVIIDLIKDFALSEIGSTNVDLSLIEFLALSGTGGELANQLSPETLIFLKEMENICKEYINVCMLEVDKDMWDIADNLNDVFNYLEYRINKSFLPANEKIMLLATISVLSYNYNFWAEVFTTSSNTWKTWWLSVNYNVNDVRKYSSNGDWISAAYNGATSGFLSGLSFEQTGWGSIMASLFSSAICAIYPKPLK
jgi:hypothetical protein